MSCGEASPYFTVLNRFNKLWRTKVRRSFYGVGVTDWPRAGRDFCEWNPGPLVLGEAKGLHSQIALEDPALFCGAARV